MTGKRHNPTVSFDLSRLGGMRKSEMRRWILLVALILVAIVPPLLVGRLQAREWRSVVTSERTFFEFDLVGRAGQSLAAADGVLVAVELYAGRDEAAGPGPHVALRLRDSSTGTVLREALVSLEPGGLSWHRVDFAPLAPGGDRALDLVIERLPGVPGHIVIGASRFDAYPGGQLSIDGASAWPDQDLQLGLVEEIKPVSLALRALGEAPLAAILVALVLLAPIPALSLAAQRLGAPRLRWSGGRAAGMGAVLGLGASLWLAVLAFVALELP